MRNRFLHSRDTSNFVYPRLLIACAVTAVVSALVLMGLRIAGAMSFSFPVHVATSGWEEESLFAMWKYVHGKKVYDDPYNIPYSIAFFNWLFYEVYGTFIALVKSSTQLSDEWIPTIGRCLTMLGLVFGTFVSYRTFLIVTAAHSYVLRTLCILFAVYLMFGPLIGFWGITIRSDVWGMVLDICAIYLFWKFYPTRPYTAVILAAIAMFVAWSFKQVDIYSAVAVGLFLLVQLRLKPLVVLTLTYFLLVAGVIAFSTDEYLKTIFLRPAIFGFDAEVMLRNLQNFSTKSTPTVFPLAVIILTTVFLPTVRRQVWLHPTGRFFAISILPLLVTAILFSSKIGAADNYYFTVSFFAAATVLVFVKVVCEDNVLGDGVVSTRIHKITVCAMGLGWCMSIAAVCVVLFGLHGIISLQPVHANYAKLRECMQKLPVPIYAPNMYASLPWMNPSTLPIITSWNYRLERKRGVAFERGGIGGMIDAGYFETLLLTDKPLTKTSDDQKDINAGPVSELDGATLAKYQATGQECGGYIIYEKKK